MIPVGPIIAEIMEHPTLQAASLSFSDLYVDTDPHGTRDLYFLAGLITYQAMYGQPAAASYTPPAEIHSAISNDFPALNACIWERLEAYNNNGVRIWP